MKRWYDTQLSSPRTHAATGQSFNAVVRFAGSGTARFSAVVTRFPFPIFATFSGNSGFAVSAKARLAALAKFAGSSVLQVQDSLLWHRWQAAAQFAGGSGMFADFNLKGRIQAVASFAGASTMLARASQRLQVAIQFAGASQFTAINVQRRVPAIARFAGAGVYSATANVFTPGSIAPNAPALSLTAGNTSDSTPDFFVDLPAGSGTATDARVGDVLAIQYGQPAAAGGFGQTISAANTGRAGAAAAGVANYSASMTTLGATTYSTSQTVRNVTFTGQVRVIANAVIFEFCRFTYAPPAAAGCMYLYNNGGSTGNVTCNWCDFDSGLRDTQGVFESSAILIGERGGGNPSTINGLDSFSFYRCSIQGFGNGISVIKYQCNYSFIQECYFNNLTSGGGSHVDGIEFYSSDNITIVGNRFDLAAVNNVYSCIQINDTPERSFPNPGRPIIVDNNYINGGTSPFICTCENFATGAPPRNVRCTNNYFGDKSFYGRECDFNYVSVTADQTYAAASPDVAYWSVSNVWAPNGEGVVFTGGSGTAPSGDGVSGLPHTPGNWVAPKTGTNAAIGGNFYGGFNWAWNGQVLGGAGAPSGITWFVYLSDTIIASDLSTANMSATGVSLSPGTYFFRAQLVRGALSSLWSATISGIVTGIVPSAPTSFTLLSSQTDTTPDVQLGLQTTVGNATDAAINDMIVGQYSSNGGASWLSAFSHTINATDVAAGSVIVAATQLAVGNYLFRARIERVAAQSAWTSNLVVNIIASSAGPASMYLRSLANKNEAAISTGRLRSQSDKG